MDCKAKWIQAEGPLSPIVVSTRVRVARNILGIPFPGTMKPEQTEEVIAKVEQVFALCSSKGDFGAFHLLRMAGLSQVDRLALVEKHMISIDLANKREGAVALRDDQAVAVMVNEEDHLRIQSLLPGLQLEQAWQITSHYDDLLEGELQFAFHEEYGYLTACPTNAGTGMRASVMLHLPALMHSNQIGKVLAAIGQFGLMARGLYGEGTEASGNMFQISNQVTSGLPEEEIIRNLRAVVEQIVAQEKAHLKSMVASNRVRLEDRVHRSIGLLANARVLDSNEAMSLISDLRLGVSAGLLTLPVNVITELMVLSQPGVLQKECKDTLDAFGRDVLRAEIIGKRLKEAMAFQGREE